MSSAPCGLDVREYLYGTFQFQLSQFGTYVISAAGEWLVTRVQMFTKDTTGRVDGPNYGSTIDIEPNGCYELEPNGAYRDAFRVEGFEAIFSVEFWFQARGTVGQSIAIYLTLPDFSEQVLRRSFPR